VTRLLKERKHPEHGYRSCLGLLALAPRVASRNLVTGCFTNDVTRGFFRLD
jgi:hypothetical protein